MESKTLFKDKHHHHHYWTEDGELYESYTTIRGMRFRHLESVPGMQDIDHLTEDNIAHVEKYYLNQPNEPQKQL